MTVTTDDPITRYTDPAWERPIPAALLAARADVMATIADLATIADAQLTTPWGWKSGSEDEIRYGFYRIYEDVELASTAAESAVRARSHDRGRTAGIIAPSTAARWDLQGILIQLPDEAWDADPGGGEWTVRQTLGHTIGGQRGYGAATAWWQHQEMPPGDSLPTERPPIYDELPEEDEEGAGTPAEVSARLDQVLDRSTERLAGMPAERLAVGSRWAGFPVDIGFRLGRWSSHLREHTIQVEKTLVMIGHTPTEVDRLIRMILGAWGRAEAPVYGSADSAEAIAALAPAAAGARLTAAEIVGLARKTGS